MNAGPRQRARLQAQCLAAGLGVDREELIDQRNAERLTHDSYLISSWPMFSPWEVYPPLVGLPIYRRVGASKSRSLLSARIVFGRRPLRNTTRIRSQQNSRVSARKTGFLQTLPVNQMIIGQVTVNETLQAVRDYFRVARHSPGIGKFGGFTDAFALAELLGDLLLVENRISLWMISSRQEFFSFSPSHGASRSNGHIYLIAVSPDGLLSRVRTADSTPRRFSRMFRVRLAAMVGKSGPITMPRFGPLGGGPAMAVLNQSSAICLSSRQRTTLNPASSRALRV
jgi:hypothetical protein